MSYKVINELMDLSNKGQRGLDRWIKATRSMMKGPRYFIAEVYIMT